MDGPLDERIGKFCIEAAKKACQSQQYQLAETMLEKLLQHTEDIDEALEFASALSMAGHVAISKRAWTEAVIFLKKAIAFIEFAQGKNDISLGSLKTALADCLVTQSKFAEAENLYEQTLRLYQDNFGQINANVALTLHNLSELATAKGEHEKAKRLSKQSRAILQIWLKDEST